MRPTAEETSQAEFRKEMLHDDSSNERRPGLRMGQLFHPTRHPKPVKSQVEPDVPEESPARKQFSERITATSPVTTSTVTEGENTPVKASRERRNIFRIGRREESPLIQTPQEEGKRGKRFHLFRNTVFSQSKDVPDEVYDTPQNSFEKSRSAQGDSAQGDKHSEEPPLKHTILNSLGMNAGKPKKGAMGKHLAEDGHGGSEKMELTLSQKLEIGRSKAANWHNGIEPSQYTQESTPKRPSTSGQGSGGRPTLDPTLSQKLMLGNQEIWKKLEERKSPILQRRSESPTLATHLRQTAQRERHSTSPSVRSKASQRSNRTQSRHRRSLHSQDAPPDKYQEGDNSSVPSRGRSAPRKPSRDEGPRSPMGSPMQQKGSESRGSRGSRERHTAASTRRPPSQSDDSPSRCDRTRNSRSKSRPRSSGDRLSKRKKDEQARSPTRIPKQIGGPSFDRLSPRSRGAKDVEEVPLNDVPDGRSRRLSSMEKSDSRRRSLSLDESLSNRTSEIKIKINPAKDSSEDNHDHSTRSEGSIRRKLRINALLEQNENSVTGTTAGQSSHEHVSLVASEEDLRRARQLVSNSSTQDDDRSPSPPRRGKAGVVSSSRYRAPRRPSARSESGRNHLSPGRQSEIPRSHNSGMSSRSPTRSTDKAALAYLPAPAAYLPKAEYLLSSPNLTNEHYRSINMMASRDYQSPFGDPPGDDSLTLRKASKSESPRSSDSLDKADSDSVARKDRTKALKNQLRNLEKFNASMRSKSPSTIDRRGRSEPVTAGERSSQSTNRHVRGHGQTHGTQKGTQRPPRQSRNRSNDLTDSERTDSSVPES